MSTREAAKFSDGKVTVTQLQQAVYRGRIPAPPRDESGNYAWSPDLVAEAVRILSTPAPRRRTVSA